MRKVMLAALVAVVACGGQSAEKTVPSVDQLPPEQKSGGELMPQGAPAVKPELVEMDTTNSTTRPVPGAAATSAAGGAGALVGGTWRWLYTQTPVETITPDDPAKYTLAFGEDGRVSGSADCNRLTGPYSVNDKQLTLGPLATTRKLCPPGGKGDLFAKQLGFVRSHFFSGDTLRMDMMADGGTFTFVRAR